MQMIIIIITNRKKNDISNEILIKTFSIFQVTDCLNYIFIYIKIEFFGTLKKDMD